MESNISDLKVTIEKDKGDMQAIEMEMNSLKAKYELKRLEVHQGNSKLEEKMRIVLEARKAYNKVIFYYFVVYCLVVIVINMSYYLIISLFHFHD